MDGAPEDYPKRKPYYSTQYMATASSTLGGLMMGISVSYSSPTSATLVASANTTECELVNGEPLTIAQVSWYNSTFHIGYFFGLILGGLCVNYIGRRGSMIFALVPSTLGWALVGLASQSYAMLVTGRTFTGINGGILSVAVPTYIGEIASPEIRGFLGSGVQVMLNMGMLYVFGFGMMQCWRWLALTCWLPSAALATAMIFNKETPSFLLMKHKHREARRALQHFRGEHENIEEEMERMKSSIAYARSHKASFTDLNKPHIRGPLIISVTLNILKQLTGFTAFITYMEIIFQSADMTISPAAASIVVAAVQAVATAVSACVVDRAGRKVMLSISACVMAVANASLGVYFYLLSNGDVTGLSWLPLTSLVVFMVAMSLGYGPIPWIILSETFSPDVKELASVISLICTGLSAFLVTLVFLPLQTVIHDYGVFWMFSAFCVLAFLFSFFVVKETKGKTMEEIMELFGGMPH